MVKPIGCGPIDCEFESRLLPQNNYKTGNLVMSNKKQEKELLNKFAGIDLNQEELEYLANLIKKSRKIEKEERFFGENIREAYHTLKGMFKKGYKT